MKILILISLIVLCLISSGQTTFSLSSTHVKTAFKISFPDSVIHVTDSNYTGRYVLKLQKERDELAMKAYEWQELYFAFVDVAAHINTPQYVTYLKKYNALKIKFGK